MLLDTMMDNLRRQLKDTTPIEHEAETRFRELQDLKTLKSTLQAKKEPFDVKIIEAKEADLQAVRPLAEMVGLCRNLAAKIDHRNRGMKQSRDTHLQIINEIDEISKNFNETYRHYDLRSRRLHAQAFEDRWARSQVWPERFQLLHWTVKTRLTSNLMALQLPMTRMAVKMLRMLH